MMMCGMAAWSQTDSLSYYIGATQGAMINRQIANTPGYDAEFRTELLKGIKAVLMADTNEIGYIDGLNMGLNLLRDVTRTSRLGVKIDREELYKQLERVVSTGRFDTKEYAVNAAGLGRYMGPVQQRYNEMQRAQNEANAAAMQAEVEKREAAGKAFIDSLVALDREVKVTPSGLAYKVIKKGKGKKPGMNDPLKVRYTGMTIDGNVFDTSGDETRTFSRAGVIKGFGEGLGMMSKGAKYMLYIPASIGYGNTGAGGQIKPGDTLVFEVELVDYDK